MYYFNYSHCQSHIIFIASVSFRVHAFSTQGRRVHGARFHDLLTESWSAANASSKGKCDWIVWNHLTWDGADMALEGMRPSPCMANALHVIMTEKY